jgi:hypothetical protein
MTGKNKGVNVYCLRCIRSGTIVMPTPGAFISWRGEALEGDSLRHTANHIAKQPTPSL